MPHKDPEKRRANKRAYYAANREKMRADQRAYRAANLEKVKGYDRAWRAANKEKVGARMRRYTTGWLPHHVEHFLSVQGGKCLICLKDMYRYKCGPHADHNHDTMQPRGLLCNNCNTTLGTIEAFLATLEPAILAHVMTSQSPWIQYLATDWASIHARLDKVPETVTIAA
jgi:hypothetical protein